MYLIRNGLVINKGNFLPDIFIQRGLVFSMPSSLSTDRALAKDETWLVAMKGAETTEEALRPISEGFSGMNGRGPTNINVAIKPMLPTRVAMVGYVNLSQICRG